MVVSRLAGVPYVSEETARDLVKKLSAIKMFFSEIREFVVDMDLEIINSGSGRVQQSGKHIKKGCRIE